MTLQTTKENLQLVLDEKENKVIALSGLWGTGKSYLWDETRKISQDSAVKNALYVSLFGVSDMATLKLKIVQSALPAAGSSSVATEMAKTAWKEGTKILRTLHAGFAALDELALLAVPAMLRNRFIVIDDIERKHDRLSIDEVMGFIDEFTQRFSSRFLLILNSDQLVDRSIWDKFLEKVIDQEVVLDTSSEEAFDIAIKLSTTPFASEIKASVLACEITNIRVIRKIIRSVNRILAGHDSLTPEILQRIMPSTVLLSAIRYKGIIDGPDVQFVLDFNTRSDAMLRAAGINKDEEAAKDETSENKEMAKQRARWGLLMDRLGISFCGEYETLLSEYLKSGSLDIEAVAKVLDGYVADATGLNLRKRVANLFELSIWHPEVSDAELLDEARAIMADAASLDASSATSLHDCVVNIPGGTDVAAQIIVRWISAFKDKDDRVVPDEPYFGRRLHPDITAALKEARAASDSKLTVADVTHTIVSRQAWGSREEAIMKASTAADYEEAIRKLNGHALKMFLLGSMDLYSHRATYESHFGQAMESFGEACRKICADPGSNRLAKVIRLVFEDSKLASHLDTKAAPISDAESVGAP